MESATSSSNEEPPAAPKFAVADTIKVTGGDYYTLPGRIISVDARSIANPPIMYVVGLFGFDNTITIAEDQMMLIASGGGGGSSSSSSSSGRSGSSGRRGTCDIGLLLTIGRSRSGRGFLVILGR